MNKVSLKSIPEQLKAALYKLSQYRLLIFILFVVLVYGFVLSRINTLYNAQPSSGSVAAQNNPFKTAHVDKAVVNQLLSLKDNSVNVQSLFSQARNNPFQE